MRRPAFSYAFQIAFFCRHCLEHTRLVQFTRQWNFVESFHSEKGATELKEFYKPEITHFRCGGCGAAVVDDKGLPVEGRRRMYNWLFNNKMLRYNGNEVNSALHRFDVEDEEKREIEQELEDGKCDPSLLP